MTEKKKITGVVITVLLIAAALLAGVAIGGFFSRPDAGKTPIAGSVGKYAEDQDYSELEEADSISIPGYDTFRFRAGRTYQEITLHNPQENTCYFKLSLILADGATLWTSDLLEPGMAFTGIELLKPMEAGTYENVTLKYDCYSLKGQTQLNGAEIKVTVIVK